MGLVLKGIELDNFKSYLNKQYIKMSDLSVLLGANSSGKSTALQALLTIKQTMECNSTDEELLLSGKYVVLGDYNEVISDSSKGYFSFSVILEQNKKSETMSDKDQYKITWKFTRGADDASAVLQHVEIDFEKMNLIFKRASGDMFNLYVDGERNTLSVGIYNLMISKFWVHYNTELNSKAVDLLNALSRIMISSKTPLIANDEPVGIETIKNFYVRILDNIPDKWVSKETSKSEELANRLVNLIDKICDLEMMQFMYSMIIFPKEIRERILELSISNLESVDELKKIIEEYEGILQQYILSKPSVEKYEGIYRLDGNPFWRADIDTGKENNLTQLKMAFDFYDDFLDDIISKMYFVGPIREMPKGLYNIEFENNPKYVGATGAYFASVLLHEDKKKREYILPRGKRKTCILSEALAAWMVHLNIASDVRVDKKTSFGFSVSVKNMEQIQSDIMNVGIGTSQVLPVMISVLLSEPNEILIFEQPELHLHPYSQSRMADMFVEFCKHGRKIILETHSEYFLLRLRYHIVKNFYSKDAVVVNFFYNSDGTKVEIGNISGFGNIEYPEGFKDETQELLDEILKAALERKGLS